MRKLNAKFNTAFLSEAGSSLHKARIKRIVFIAIPVLLIIFSSLGFAYYRHERKKDQLTVMAGHIAGGKTLYEEDKYVQAGEEYKAAHDIAKRLKLENEQKSLENYCKTIELIVAADAALQQKHFINAVQKYQAALDACNYADQLGHSYIMKQQRLADSYMKVTELLHIGDQKVALEDLAGGHQAYMEAKVIASRIYYAEGCKEATDKLATVGSQMTEESKKTTEQEATGYEKQGDKLAQMEDYEGALEMWNIACDMYAQTGKSNRSAIVQTKIANITDRKNTVERFEQQRLAMELEKEGDSELTKKQFKEARYDFVAAQEAYGAAGHSNNVALVQKKIDAIDKKLKRK
jgi:tetratricopeptide (TPR) repeat protein